MFAGCEVGNVVQLSGGLVIACHAFRRHKGKRPGKRENWLLPANRSYTPQWETYVDWRCVVKAWHCTNVSSGQRGAPGSGGPSKWALRKEAKRQMYALSTEKAPTIRPLGVRYPHLPNLFICGRNAHIFHGRTSLPLGYLHVLIAEASRARRPTTSARSASTTGTTPTSVRARLCT